MVHNFVVEKCVKLLLVVFHDSRGEARHLSDYGALVCLSGGMYRVADYSVIGGMRLLLTTAKYPPPLSQPITSYIN